MLASCFYMMFNTAITAFCTIFLLFPFGNITPIICGSIIESPLFREFELSHHCIHGVCPTFLLSPITVFHPSSLCTSLVSHILASSHTVSYPLRSHISSFQVIHALYALKREVVSSLLSTPPFHHYPWCESIS